MAGAAAIASIAASGASIVGSMSKPKSAPTNSGNYNFYQPTNPGVADEALQYATNNANQVGAQIQDFSSPAAFGATNYLLNNPYSFQAQQGADYLYNMTSAVTPQAFSNSASLSGLGALGASYVPAALTAGFDPQGDIYNRERAKTLDSANAINSMYGLSASPYGAGVANEALNSFNLDWQNTLLGRQNTAANTAYTLGAGAGQNFTGASNLNSAALVNGASAAMLPYSTHQQFGADQLAALGGLSSLANSWLTPNSIAASGAGAYLGAGNSANYGGMYGQQQQFNQGQTQGANFGAGLAGLASGIGSLPQRGFTPAPTFSYIPPPGVFNPATGRVS